MLEPPNSCLKRAPPPVPEPVWRLSALGESCKKACAGEGLWCNIDRIQNIVGDADVGLSAVWSDLSAVSTTDQVGVF